MRLGGAVQVTAGWWGPSHRTAPRLLAQAWRGAPDAVIRSTGIGSHVRGCSAPHTLAAYIAHSAFAAGLDLGGAELWE